MSDIEKMSLMHGKVSIYCSYSVSIFHKTAILYVVVQ